jgi:hypothetical protein
MAFAPPKAKALCGIAAITAAEPISPACLRKSRRTVDFIVSSPSGLRATFESAMCRIYPDSWISKISFIQHDSEYSGQTAGLAGEFLCDPEALIQAFRAVQTEARKPI